jgi:16S rRNA (cytosine967-C5)-methyltransferase
VSRESDRGFARMRWKRAFLNQQRYLEQLWLKYLTKAVQDKKFYQFDLWIEKEFKLNKQFGKRDRQWYSECLYSGLRFARLALALWQKEQAPIGDSFEIFSSSEELAKRLVAVEPGFFWRVIEQRVFLEEEIDLDLRDKILKIKKQKSLENLLIFQGVGPEWSPLIKKRIERSSWSDEDLDQFLVFLSQKAPLWIRINGENHLTYVLNEFQKETVEVVNEDGCALLVQTQKKINQLDLFLKGKFEIQDWASQQILSLFKVGPFSEVWDACAGGGGKSVQIASQLKGGRLFFSDIRENKLKNTSERLKKLGFKNFESFVWNGESSLKNKFFDVIVVDAPCSSSGVLRRNPELRLKIFPDDLFFLKELQLKILQSACHSLKTGGYLLYGTCSLFVEENEEVVESFINKNKDFVLDSMKLHGSPKKNSDTTFSALFKKI